MGSGSAVWSLLSPPRSDRMATGPHGAPLTSASSTFSEQRALGRENFLQGLGSPWVCTCNRFGGPFLAPSTARMKPQPLPHCPRHQGPDATSVPVGGSLHVSQPAMQTGKFTSCARPGTVGLGPAGPAHWGPDGPAETSTSHHAKQQPTVLLTVEELKC